MKRDKIITIIGLIGMLCFGIVIIVNIVISSANTNPLTLYEFWGFGVAPTLFSILYLQKVLQKPKKIKK